MIAEVSRRGPNLVTNGEATPMIRSVALTAAALSLFAPARAHDDPRVLEAFDDVAGWQVAWTGRAVGSAEALEGSLRIEARYDEATERKGHSRLTMTRTFDAPQDFSPHTGIGLRLRVTRPLNTSLWVHLLEAKGVRYRCDTFAKMSAVGEDQELLIRFDTDFSWDFESSSDANQKLDLTEIVGLRLMMSIPEGGDGALEIDDLSFYTEPPEPTTNLIWIKSEGGALNVLPPGTSLPAPIPLTVTGGKLEPDVKQPRLQWSALDAWKRPLADGSVDLKRAGEHTAPARIELATPGYSALDLTLLDGDRALRRQRFCLAALPRPAPEDATPRTESIFGIWPGGYGAWIKLGAKWARTYCQPWDFEPQPDGGYRYIRRDKEGQLQPFAPNLEPGLNYICFFRGMPKWLSSRPERADWKKFPPTDWDEYARFVTHYVGLMKDRIRVWEVWNEPVPYAYWMGTIEEVVKLHEVTYKAVKRAQPDSIVLGPCPYRIRLEFTERFFELGGGKWIDAAVVHAYAPSPDPHFADDLRWLKEIMRKHGGEKDIWVTEVGWGTRRHTELQQASYLVQTYVLGLSEGVHTIVWHMNWDYNDTMLRGGHGLLRHNHQPKPGLVAYATLIRTLEGAKFVSGQPSPEATRVFLFEKAGRRIWVAWAGKPDTPWRPPITDFTALNMMGVPIASADGTLRLSEAPIYVLE